MVRYIDIWVGFSHMAVVENTKSWQSMRSTVNMTKATKRGCMTDCNREKIMVFIKCCIGQMKLMKGYF